MTMEPHLERGLARGDVPKGDPHAGRRPPPKATAGQDFPGVEATNEGLLAPAGHLGPGPGRQDVDHGSRENGKEHGSDD